MNYQDNPVLSTVISMLIGLAIAGIWIAGL